MRVLITGAGVAGLTSALALRQTGIHDITIVERASHVAAHGGTGVAIPPNGTRALAAIGLPVERLIARGCRLHKYRFLNRAGHELSCADLTRRKIELARRDLPRGIGIGKVARTVGAKGIASGFHALGRNN